QGVSDEARKGKKYGEIPWRLGILEPAGKPKSETLEGGFFLGPGDVKRRLRRPEGERRLAFEKHRGGVGAGRKRCKEKLAELLNVTPPARACAVKEVRETRFQSVRIKALVMTVDDDLSIPAYLLIPPKVKEADRAVIAIHGHGDIEPCIGQRD